MVGKRCIVHDWVLCLWFIVTFCFSCLTCLYKTSCLMFSGVCRKKVLFHEKCHFRFSASHRITHGFFRHTCIKLHVRCFPAIAVKKFFFMEKVSFVFLPAVGLPVAFSTHLYKASCPMFSGVCREKILFHEKSLLRFSASHWITRSFFDISV